LTVEKIIKELSSFYNEQLHESNEIISFEQIYFFNLKSKIIDFIRYQIVFACDLISDKKKNESSKPIKTAQAYLVKNYADDQLSLDSLSEMVHLTPTYFSALFKKETDKGFAEYLRELRIEKSTELLVNTVLSIKDVSKKVGYHDSRYFTKCFKKQYGIKPQDYRKLYG
jgi:two-component system response regulator YesN